MTASEGLFWAKVDVGVSGLSCWEWTASRTPGGYGFVRIATRPHMAHRAAYEFLIGPIPEGLVIDHLCRNKGCVNPDRLEVVTQRENVRRGRAGAESAARGRASTHCTNGHERTEQNSYPLPAGGLSCKTCRRDATRRYRIRRITNPDAVFDVEQTGL